MIVGRSDVDIENSRISKNGQPLNALQIVFSLKLQIVNSFTNGFSFTSKGLVTVTLFGEIAEGYLRLVTFLLDVIQDRHELTSRYETGEHCYGLASRIEKDKGGKSRDAKRIG